MNNMSEKTAYIRVPEWQAKLTGYAITLLAIVIIPVAGYIYSIDSKVTIVNERVSDIKQLRTQINSNTNRITALESQISNKIGVKNHDGNNILGIEVSTQKLEVDNLEYSDYMLPCVEY